MAGANGQKPIKWVWVGNREVPLVECGRQRSALRLMLHRKNRCADFLDWRVCRVAAA